ncbi:MAG: DUF4238 domain-containing protein [Negativicutes bacterium]|nr:DUF4238 domain-containing protein [Negativicutes bacterium]
MAQYKKQHYLPASYLRYFSEDQSNCRRDSFVWQYDGKEARRVSVRAQCYRKYFYSKKNPADVEKMFQKREEIYCPFVDKIRAGQEPEIQNFGDLFLCICDLYIRNAAHKNYTGREGIGAYNDRLVLFFSGLLLGDAEATLSIEDIKQHLQTNWRLEIIPAPVGFQYLTSDHPTVFMACNNPPNPKNPLQIILLALDPTNIAVAFDRRFVCVERKTATANDVTLFNVGQVHNATKVVYSAMRFTGNALTFCETAFLQKKSVCSEVTPKGWKLSLTYLPPQSHFSFIQMNMLLL